MSELKDKIYVFISRDDLERQLSIDYGSFGNVILYPGMPFHFENYQTAVVSDIRKNHRKQLVITVDITTADMEAIDE